MANPSNCPHCKKKQCTCKNGCEKCKKVKDAIAGIWRGTRDDYCKCND